MLRISIGIVLLVLGSVRAVIYTDVESSLPSFAEGRPNKYFAIRVESSDNGWVYYLDILRDITPELGLQLCEKWEYDNRGIGGTVCGRTPGSGPPLPPHNGTIHGPVCRDLCCALEELAARNPPFPRPDKMLGLCGRRCPLKKGSIRIPSVSMPKVLKVDLELVSDFTDYEGEIRPKEYSSDNNLDPFVTGVLVFVACNRKN